MDDYSIYGFDDKLKALRKKHSITQEELGVKIGVAKNTVNRYGNENLKPSLDTMIKIALTFNVSLDYLVGLSKDEYVKVLDFPQEQSELILEFLDIWNDKINKNKKSGLI